MEHQENIVFFEDDMQKKSSTKYISRFLFAFSNRVLIRNFKQMVLIAIALGVAFAFSYQLIVLIGHSMDKASVQKNIRYTEFQKTIKDHTIEDFNTFLNMPIKKHEESIQEYFEIYNKLSAEQKKEHDYDVQISAKKLSTQLAETKEKVADMKKSLLPIYQYDNPDKFPYYNEDSIVKNIEFLQAIKTDNFDFPSLMTDGYKKLLVKIENMKNIVALK